MLLIYSGVQDIITTAEMMVMRPVKCAHSVQDINITAAEMMVMRPVKCVHSVQDINITAAEMIVMRPVKCAHSVQDIIRSCSFRWKGNALFVGLVMPFSLEG